MAAFNLGDIFVTLKAKTDNLDRGLKTTQDKFDAMASSVTRTLKIIGVAGGALSGALVLGATKAYASYEQLTGGIETLFKNSSDTVKKYAIDAYQTAGLSANQYMDTVTSFAASLLQGLGGDTAKAAEIAHMAVVDMADNANKMGTDISLIQNAYQGFAKDNFTMLDNLKLGFGGTASEMARLVNESGVLGEGVKVTAETVAEVPFDKIITAIHIIQEKMGIAGTTALEGSTTISGSLSQLKAAWTNFLTGTEGSGEQLMTALSTVFDVLRERIPEILGLLGQNIKEFITELLDKNPELARFLTILRDIAMVITALLLPGIIRYIALQAVAAAQSLIAGASMARAWMMALGPIGLIGAAVVALVALIIMHWDTVKGWLSDFWNWLKDSASAAWEGVKKAFSKVGEFFGGIWDTVKKKFTDIGSKIGDAVGNAFKTAVNGVLGFLERQINGIIKIINGALNAVDKITPGSLPRISEVSLPRLATGTSNWAGGAAIMNEFGPETAVLPKGTRVLTAEETRRAESAGGGGNTYILNLKGMAARSESELADLFEAGIKAFDRRMSAAGKPTILRSNG